MELQRGRKKSKKDILVSLFKKSGVANYHSNRIRENIRIGITNKIVVSNLLWQGYSEDFQTEIKIISHEIRRKKGLSYLEILFPKHKISYFKSCHIKKYYTKTKTNLNHNLSSKYWTISFKANSLFFKLNESILKDRFGSLRNNISISRASFISSYERYFSSKEYVFKINTHHINGNSLDDTEANLIELPEVYHKLYHHFKQNKQRNQKHAFQEISFLSFSQLFMFSSFSNFIKGFNLIPNENRLISLPHRFLSELILNRKISIECKPIRNKVCLKCTLSTHYDLWLLKHLKELHFIEFFSNIKNLTNYIRSLTNRCLKEAGFKYLKDSKAYIKLIEKDVYCK